MIAKFRRHFSTRLFNYLFSIGPWLLSCARRPKNGTLSEGHSHNIEYLLGMIVPLFLKL